MRPLRFGPRALRNLAIASLIGNIGIVCTGGAVRLTGSGLGCPTWPRCTEESWTPHGALDIHGAIEFGNRMIALVLAGIAILTWIAALQDRPRRPGVRLLATLLALGVPAQAVVGGLTVRTDLSPAWVAPHFLLSMVMIALAVALIRRVDEPAGPVRPVGPAPLRALAWLTFAATLLVLYLGTVVTGSGPHAGDENAERTGFDPEAVSQLHADAVFLLIGLTIGLVFGLRAVRREVTPRATRAVTLLLVAELCQGLVGAIQYALGLPIVVVELHLLGSALVMAAATAVVLAMRVRIAPSDGRDDAPAVSSAASKRGEDTEAAAVGAQPEAASAARTD